MTELTDKYKPNVNKPKKVMINVSNFVFSIKIFVEQIYKYSRTATNSK